MNAADSPLLAEIEAMPYVDMLRLWRHAETGHPLLSGEVGDFFAKNMAAKRDQLTHEQRVAASKQVGWFNVC